MTNDETKLINRRDALAMLGAIGISGMVRISSQGKDFKADKDNEKTPARADESAEIPFLLGENSGETDLMNPS